MPKKKHPMSDVEGIHEGRGLKQRQEKPVSVWWGGPFSGAGTHKAIYANRPSKHVSPPFFCMEKAYMSINHCQSQAHLVWKAGCSMSVPGRPILKHSDSEGASLVILFFGMGKAYMSINHCQSQASQQS